MSNIASTLANYGISPLTEKKCLLKETVKKTIQLLFTCGKIFN
jgi:glutaminase